MGIIKSCNGCVAITVALRVAPRMTPVLPGYPGRHKEGRVAAEWHNLQARAEGDRRKDGGPTSLEQYHKCSKRTMPSGGVGSVPSTGHRALYPASGSMPWNLCVKKMTHLGTSHPPFSLLSLPLLRFKGRVSDQIG